MVVYGSSVSPFVRKVLAFAAEKGLEVKVKGVALGSQDPAFREASPFGKMPALRHGDFLLADSSAIVAYMDALQHEPVLIPAEPRERGKTIWWDEFADTIFISACVKIFFNRVVAPRFLGEAGDEAVAARAIVHEVPPLLEYIEGSIPASGWLVGDRLTLADISVVTGFANLRYAGCPVDAARYPKLAIYVDKLLARPSFARSLAHEAKLFAG
jgi:glutathione S-transferase